jgi:hypothetical protein
VVEVVGDVQQSCLGGQQAAGVEELELGCGSAVAREPRLLGAGDGGDRPVAINLADALAVMFGDEQISGAVDRDSPGVVQSGGGRRAAVATRVALREPATVLMMPARLTLCTRPL